MTKLDTNKVRDNVKIKLIIEKIALATGRFIKGEITREVREGYYDEAYDDISDSLQQQKEEMIKEAKEKIYEEVAKEEDRITVMAEIMRILDSLTKK